MREIVITPEIAGGRLDKLLFKYLDCAGSGFVYKMLRKKNITLNDRKTDGNVILNAGDSVKLYLAEETIAKFRSSEDKKNEGAPDFQDDPVDEGKAVYLPEIVYEDDNIIAINKPSGMLSQRSGRGDYSANDFVLSHVPSSDVFKPGIANRLDRNTSGIVLAGKNPAAARELSRAIKERSISKKYLTLVTGKVTEGGHLEGNLFKDSRNNTVKVKDLSDKEKTGTLPVQDDADKSSMIITEYAPVARGEGFTLLEVDLITGKSHQIRAHMASIGHAIAGDPKYGDRAVNIKLKEQYGLKNQMLHAYKIEFNEMRGILEYLNGTVIEAPLPELFAMINKRLFGMKPCS